MPETTKIQALIAETKDDIGVGFVMYQMGTIDSQLIAKNEIMTKRSNTAKIDEMINTFAPSMTISMILMSILLIILVYSKYIENRQIEINLLRVNGLRKLEVVKVVIMELLIHALIIGISSTILLFVLYQIMQETLNTFLSFSMIQSFFISTIISLGLIFIPAFISLTIFQRQDIADIMRNH